VYVCQGGAHVKCDADDLDAVAEEGVIGWLSRPEVAEVFRSPPDALPELERVRGEAAAKRGLLQEWQQRAANGEVSPASFAAIEPPILAEIRRLEGRERELSAPSALARWAGPEDEVRGRWGRAPLEARRSLIRGLGSYMGTLTLNSVSRGHRVPASKRVTWNVWGDDDHDDHA
jgi:hypothetical protein